MKCKFFRNRHEKGKVIYFCKTLNRKIEYTECFNCYQKEFKQYKRMRIKSKKLKQKEDNRYSIFTKDLSKCFVCDLDGKVTRKSDLHEVYGGSNRQRSIENGLVVPLCRECHQNEEKILELRKICQEIYELNHTREQFIQLIGISYLK